MSDWTTAIAPVAALLGVGLGAWLNDRLESKRATRQAARDAEIMRRDLRVAARAVSSELLFAQAVLHNSAANGYVSKGSAERLATTALTQYRDALFGALSWTEWTAVERAYLVVIQERNIAAFEEESRDLRVQLRKLGGDPETVKLRPRPPAAFQDDHERLRIAAGVVVEAINTLAPHTDAPPEALEAEASAPPP